MTPTEVLREEHRVILRALAVLDRATDSLAAGSALPDGWWEAIIQWLRAFADRTHHAKEERYLFPALDRAGVPPEGGPLAVMLAEHVEGRDLIQAMAVGERARRVEGARAYVQLLRDHIDKENGVLFPLTDAVLEASALDALARAFENVEVEQGAGPSIEHAEAAVELLEATLGGARVTRPGATS